MCGITGFASFDRPVKEFILRGMLSEIKHRGPDDTGIFITNNVGLGIQRLSIIDLKTGNQPISNEDRSIIVVFNGEIYNFQELHQNLINNGHQFKTKTDTEILVHLYEEYGVKMTGYLNGMFAFAIWDQKKEMLFIARDQVGIKPLYFWTKGRTIVFGSELKALLKHPFVEKEIDEPSIMLYSFLGYIPQERSAFKNIYKLNAGEQITFSQRGLNKSIYFKLENIDKPKCYHLDSILEQAVKHQSISDVPLGVFLSGGIDSSLVTYYLTNKSSKIKSFSIGFEETTFDESKYAEQVANILGTKHYHDTFHSCEIPKLLQETSRLLDEPLADPSFFPTYKVSQLAKKHVKVALSGDGGDELFGGYPTYQGHLLANKLQCIPQQAINLLLLLLAQFRPTDTNYPLQDMLKTFFSGLKMSPPYRHLHWMSMENTGQIRCRSQKTQLTDSLRKLIYETYNSNLDIRFFDFQTYLKDDLLAKVDRASMFNSLEVRVPLLDLEVVKYAVHSNNHYDLFVTKEKLRRIASRVLPKQIAYRKKKGFGIPLAKWLRGELKAITNEMLHNHALYVYFDSQWIDMLWNEHQQGMSNNARVIWMLSMLSMWLDSWAK